MVKALLSILVSDDIPGSDESDGDLELAIFDISRAHFMAKVDREIYVEVVDEDRVKGDGDCVGLLCKSMYGCRAASANWMKEWQDLLESETYQIGVANPALYYSAVRRSRGGVQGDDFVGAGPNSSLDHFGKILETRYSVRESHRLGFRKGCQSLSLIHI